MTLALMVMQGHYLTEQTMAFCQVILHENLVAPLKDPANYPPWVTPELRQKLIDHREKHPEDPVPFPLNDPEPQVLLLIFLLCYEFALLMKLPQITIPVDKDCPWHTQVSLRLEPPPHKIY
jgi:hypothetical protein